VNRTRHPGPAKWMAGATLALVLGGCTVGNGTGQAAGELYVKGCTPNGDFGNGGAPIGYDLEPEFFAGEPIEDIKKDGTINRIVLRLQNSGKSIEANDLLQFDVVNSYLVATCLAGKALPDEQFRAFCQTPPGQTRPRMRVGPNLPIRASLAVRYKCPSATLIGTARDGDGSRIDAIVPLPLDQWRSWIEFSAFGSATRGDVPPTFRVEFNERITADRFHVELVDDRVIEAERRRDPPPTPDLVGMLEGNFDFELERGQGAQTFP
jgi:hypothetical protein